MIKQTLRSKGYLKWIRRQPCAVSKRTHEIIAHHIRIGQCGGMGMKPSDYRCVPLNVNLHSRLHNMGERTFFEDHVCDPDMLIATYLVKYIMCNELTKDLVILLEDYINKEIGG